jgi:hypothetical protein
VNLTWLSETATFDRMKHRMRIATICAMAISISLVAGGAVAQNSVANALAGAGTRAREIVNRSLQKTAFTIDSRSS